MSHANKLFQTDVLLALSIPATVAGQAPPQTTRLCETGGFVRDSKVRFADNPPAKAIL